MSRSARLQAEITARLQSAMASSSLSSAEQQQCCQKTPNYLSLQHLHEQISAEVAFLVAQNAGPTPLLTALLALNLAPLCPMAAEAHSCAAHQTQQDQFVTLLTRHSPIFTFKKNLFAAPVGDLDEFALQQFGDRILKHLKDAKIKTVHLHLDNLSTAAKQHTTWQTFLREELQAMGVGLVVREEW